MVTTILSKTLRIRYEHDISEKENTHRESNKIRKRKTGPKFFVRISGNERKVPYLGVLESNKDGKSGLLGMEMERRWDERK